MFFLENMQPIIKKLKKLISVILEKKITECIHTSQKRCRRNPAYSQAPHNISYPISSSPYLPPREVWGRRYITIGFADLLLCPLAEMAFILNSMAFVQLVCF